MKTLTALITTLALGGGASIASANHNTPTTYDRRTGIEYRSDSAGRYDRTAGRYARYDQSLDRRSNDWRSHRTPDEFGPRHYRTSWVALDQSVQLSRRGAYIDVTDRGTFTQLRLQTAGNPARVDRLIVEFTDGSQQLVNVGRTLDGYFDIALDGNNRRIDRVVVTGGARGDLQLFGI
jgi:hypothetical protein